jgi:hypothetical protein
MKAFSFDRFLALLIRVLEIGVIVSLALRWFDATLGFSYRITLPWRAYDAVLGFSLLAILVLLFTALFLLLKRQIRASRVAIRAMIYVVVFCISPNRLGSSGPRATQMLNQTIQRTAGPLACSLPAKFRSC